MLGATVSIPVFPFMGGFVHVNHCNFIIVLLTAIPPHSLTHAYMLVFSTYGTATMFQLKEIIWHIHQSIFYMLQWTLQASSNAPHMPVSSLIDMCRMNFNDTYSFILLKCETDSFNFWKVLCPKYFFNKF